MGSVTQRVTWQGQAPEEAMNSLNAGGGLIVAPTKVGYILMATDGLGLERKFAAKKRKRSKPGVVLCASVDQVARLAQMNPEILDFYQRHWDEDVLLGCILPWREDSLQFIPDETTRQLAMDQRGTSCFVIRFGRPAEGVAEELWKQGKLAFASSANPSGVGNRGRVEGIGDRIAEAADVIIESDEYVASNQPGKDESTRHEQGVMVSMVDDSGALIPEQKGERGVQPGPILIRKGLDYDAVMKHLSEVYSTWDYRHGQYY